MSVTAASLQSLLTSIAADGGELLRQLGAEHEKEVVRLHSENIRLQGELARFTGAPSTEIKSNVGLQLNQNSRNTSPAVMQSSGEGQAQELSTGGMPDENALAKAFAFVDAIDIDRELSNSTRYGSAYHDSEALHAMPSTAPPAHGASLSPPTSGASMLMARAFSADDTYGNHPGGVLDPSGKLSIKLSKISPQVQAPKLMLEPPGSDDDTDWPLSPVGSHSESPSSKSGKVSVGPVAAPAINCSRPAPEDPSPEDPSLLIGLASFSEHAQKPSAWRSGDAVHEDLSWRSGDVDFPHTAANRSVPVFVKSVSKPEHERLGLASGAMQAGTVQDALTARGRASSGIMPSRETTTWQPTLEELMTAENDKASSFESAGYAEAFRESSGVHPAPTINTVSSVSISSQMTVPPRAASRPSGDDGVGIGIYLEAPHGAAPSEKAPHGAAPNEKAPQSRTCDQI